jgi:hypothetical protein
MQLEDEKVSENRKLRRLENQKVGSFKTCQPSHLLAPHLLTFLFLKIFVFFHDYPRFPLSLVASGTAEGG